jgi:hypothetical protein
MTSSEMFILFIYVLVSGISFFSMGYKAGVAKGRCEGFKEASEIVDNVFGKRK